MRDSSSHAARVRRKNEKTEEKKEKETRERDKKKTIGNSFYNELVWSDSIHQSMGQRGTEPVPVLVSCAKVWLNWCTNASVF